MNTIDTKILDNFLVNELTAVETYDKCINKVDNREVMVALESLKRSHLTRANLLEQRIRALGSEPSQSSGIWGGFAKMVEGGAKLFGENSAMAVLEEGEDKGLDNYRTELSKLSKENQAFITNTILPEQKRSHDELNSVMDMAKEIA